MPDTARFVEDAPERPAFSPQSRRSEKVPVPTESTRIETVARSPSCVTPAMAMAMAGLERSTSCPGLQAQRSSPSIATKRNHVRSEASGTVKDAVAAAVPIAALPARATCVHPFVVSPPWNGPQTA